MVVVGAGLSGVGAACRLELDSPGTTYAVLEARDAIGGTWDLFRYPGVRSDSDLATFGYPFRPWRRPEQFAAGADICAYIADTAEEFGVDRHVRLGHRVTSADWSSADARWTVRVALPGGGERTWTCRVLYACTGYYAYDRAHAPTWPGQDRYAGRVVHPQFWPEDLDWRDRHVVVVGSGATAVTLVPALAEQAASVTMLQRSPSYVTALPSVDRSARRLARVLPRRTADTVRRVRSAVQQQGFYALCRRHPRSARWLLRRGVVAHLGPETADEHFTPDYDPWDQRLCVAPDGDLFTAIARGRAAVVTDTITGFGPDRVQLASGRSLRADVVVSATGLDLLALGGMRLAVDGVAVDPGRHVAYRGVMLDGVPNFAFCVGYANASWTLRSDLSSRFVARFVRHLDRRGLASGTPTRPADLATFPLLPLTAGYVRRAVHAFPQRGGRAPWTLPQNYLLDLLRAVVARPDRDMAFAARPVRTGQRDTTRPPVPAR